MVRMHQLLVGAVLQLMAALDKAGYQVLLHTTPSSRQAISGSLKHL